MLCFVYKSPRKSDTYVYLRERDGFGVLPEALTATLGTLVFVMELELSPARKLARENTLQVIESLHERGFHLQLPPPVETLLLAPLA